MKRIMIITGTILAMSLTLIILANNYNKAEHEKRSRDVQIYTKCLDEHFHQRDYCARLQGYDYRILDQYVEYEKEL